MNIICLIITAVMRLIKSKNITESVNLASFNGMATSSRCSPERASLRSDAKEEAKKQRIVMHNYQTFKKFDFVNDFSDHHYCNTWGFRGYQVT